MQYNDIDDVKGVKGVEHYESEYFLIGLLLSTSPSSKVLKFKV